MSSNAETTAGEETITSDAKSSESSSNNKKKLVPVEATRDILTDLDRLQKLFGRIRESRQDGAPLSSNAPGPSKDTKNEDFFVPVFHTFLIKQLREDSDLNHPIMVGTFVQHIFGLPFAGVDGLKEAPNQPFPYMFNYKSAQNEIEFRRSEGHRVEFPTNVTLPHSPSDSPEAPPPRPKDAAESTSTACANLPPISSPPTNPRTTRYPPPPPPPPLPKGAEESDFIPDTRYTYHVEARMRMHSEFDRFPFTVFRGVVRVELDSRNYEEARQAGGKCARFIPRLLLHAADSRNNLCLQELKGGVGGGTEVHGRFRWNRRSKERRQRQMELIEKGSNRRANRCGFFGGADEELGDIEKNFRTKLDEMSRFAMISPFPEVEYSFDKDGQCQTFFVSFWLVEEGLPKFIRVIVPMILVAALNSINVIIQISRTIKEKKSATAAVMSGDVKEEEEDLSGFADEAVNYLNTAVTLGLTAVFLLPNIGADRRNMEGLSMNDLYVFLVFLSLALSSLPPALIDSNIVGIVGMSLLWLSFAIPVCNLIFYNILIYNIKADRRAAWAKHKFLKDDTMKMWKPTSKKAVHTPLEEFVYTKYCTPEGQERGENNDDADQELTQWETRREFYGVDQISRKKFQIFY